MVTADPLVTVLIPSYNHARWLSYTIESVLAQTYPNIELVVVDDGSADDSLAIAEGFAAGSDQITVLTHPGGGNRGIGATANLGWQNSRGTYWLGLNSDDMLAPEAIARLVAAFERDPNAAFAYGDARVVDETGQPRQAAPLASDLNRHRRPLEWLLHTNCIPGLTGLIRSDALAQLGAAPFRNIAYPDWDIWVRLLAHGGALFVPEIAGYYRVHGANSTIEKDPSVSHARHLEVLECLDSEAVAVGGDLARPRTRAAIRLELALRNYAYGHVDRAADWVAAAFEADPALDRDASWLEHWLFERLDRRSEFPAWLVGQAPATLSSALRRPATAARIEQQADAEQKAGNRRAAFALAARVLWLNPTRLKDPRFLRLLARILLRRSLRESAL